MANKTKAMPRIVVWGDAEVKRVRILNGQAWSPGEFLRANTGGLLKTCVTGDDAAAGGIGYFSLQTQADPGNSTTFENVVKIANNTIFEGNLHHDSAASAVATTAVIGQQYGLDVTSNVHTVDMDEKNSANAAFEVTEIGNDYNEAEDLQTDQYGHVRFKVLTTVLEAAPAA